MHPWLVYTDWLRLPTYFTCLMIGFSVATFVLRREARREGLPVRVVMDLALWTVPTVLVGARLAHVLVEAPRFYWEHPLAALRVAYGGFVFYGGLAAGAALLMRWAQRHLPDPLLAVSLHPAPLHASLFALALFVFLTALRARQRVPGEVVLAFIGFYGIGRSVLELFRADRERGLWLGGWVSTSQAIGLTTAAVALALRARRRHLPTRSAPR